MSGWTRYDLTTTSHHLTLEDAPSIQVSWEYVTVTNDYDNK